MFGQLVIGTNSPVLFKKPFSDKALYLEVFIFAVTYSHGFYQLYTPKTL